MGSLALRQETVDDLLCGSQPVDDEVFSVEPPQSPEAQFIADAWEPREREDDACALPERVDDDADSFADLPQMVEAATRREYRGDATRCRPTPSPTASAPCGCPERRSRRRRGDAGAASTAGRTCRVLTKPAVTPRRRRAAWRGQHGEADVAEAP